jgi:carboxypeptidase T
MFPTVFLISGFKEFIMSFKTVLIMLMLVFAICLSASEKAVVRINQPTQEIVDYYFQNNYDIAAYFPGRWLDLVVTVNEIPNLRLIHPDLQITQTEGELEANLNTGGRVLPGYRSYAQIVSELNTLAAQYSNIMSITTIGTGWGALYNQQGYTNYANYDHNITAIKVSANPTIEEDEPAVFFMGEHHAREPLSVEVTMAVLNDLLDSYNTDPWVTDLINSTAIWFVPMVNPDGHKIVWDQLDVWWRKNIRDNNNNQTISTDNNYGYGYDGVDLNRNYGFSWGYISATDVFDDPVYHGPEEFSEPETQAVRDFLASHPFLAGVSFHTYSELILYPYGYVNGISAPDIQELSALAEDMAEVFPAEGGGFYTPGPGWGLYPTSGGLDDWAYGEQGIFCYTIELSTSFIPGSTTVNLVTQRAIPVARKLMERTTRSMLTGLVTDGITRNPIEAVIYIEGIDNSPVSRAPYMSRLPFGRYYRLLPPGEWSIRVYAAGYLPFEGQVTISDTEVTNLNVDLFSAGQSPLTVIVQTFGEVPVEGVMVDFLNTDMGPMYTDAAGMIFIPEFQYGYYDIRVSKQGFETINCSYTITSPQLAFLFSDFPYVYYDFETNLSGWTTNGGWGLSTQQSFSGTKSLADSPTSDYNDNWDSYARLSVPLNLQNFVNVSLSFYAKADIVQDGDYCSLEFSTDNQNWNVLDYYDGNFDWTQKTYDLNGLIGQQVYLRFHMLTTGYQSADGIFIDDVKIYGSGVVGNQEDFQVPVLASLSAYPNPFVTQVKIKINLETDQAARTELDVYNIKGQKVASLMNKTLTKGYHETEWNGRDSKGNQVGSGIYYTVLKINGCKANTHKILLTK